MNKAPVNYVKKPKFKEESKSNKKMNSRNKSPIGNDVFTVQMHDTEDGLESKDPKTV